LQVYGELYFADELNYLVLKREHFYPQWNKMWAHYITQVPLARGESTELYKIYDNDEILCQFSLYKYNQSFLKIPVLYNI
jgi:hypothetical protein